MRDLALHILDLARNSIEAGATELEITVLEQPSADRLEITIQDNGRGMDEETRRQACDPFYTSRTTRRVGLGLSLFRATCERCEGGMRLESRPGEGTRVVGRLRLWHLDRPPLGDMGGVIAALACEADRVGLRYSHQAQAGRFELDTAAVQTELGEGAMGRPAVLLWLQEHVREGVRRTGSVA